MKKIGKYVWAFLVVLVLFVISGFATLGSAASTGESLSYVAEKTVMFSLGGAKKLDSVYINVGAIHAGVGAQTDIEVEYTTSSSPSLTSGSDITQKFQLSNIYSETGKNGYNYNWLTVVTGKKLSNVRYLYFKATQNLELNEIVAFDSDGKQIELTPYTNGNGYEVEELAAAVDAQDSYRSGTSRYYTVSQEEALSLTAANTLLSGKTLMSGSRYSLDGNFGIWATAFIAAPVAVFGNSAFAVRFTPFVAACVALVFVFLFAKELFKSEKYAFMSAALFAFGGLATSVGGFGAGYAMVAAALLASAYFMYRFFARGISAYAVVKGGMNILISGLFAAMAICMETLSIIPVAAILVLFVFGVLRMKKAYAVSMERFVAKEELSEEETAEQKKMTVAYAYKKRVAFGFAALSFVVGTMVFLLLGGVFFYSALVKTYDASTQSMSFLSLVWMNVVDSAMHSYSNAYVSASAATPFAWLLPLTTATMYSASVDGTYLAWSAQLNSIACVAAFAGMIFVTVKVILAMVKKQADKKTLRIRRIWIVLLAAMVTTMLAAMIKGDASIISGLAFSAAYLAFIPLALMVMEEDCNGCEKAKSLAAILFDVVLVAVAVLFIISIPATYGFAVPVAFSRAFTWTSVLNNGYFRI